MVVVGWVAGAGLVLCTGRGSVGFTGFGTGLVTGFGCTRRGAVRLGVGAGRGRGVTRRAGAGRCVGVFFGTGRLMWCPPSACASWRWCSTTPAATTATSTRTTSTGATVRAYQRIVCHLVRRRGVGIGCRLRRRDDRPAVVERAGRPAAGQAEEGTTRPAHLDWSRRLRSRRLWPGRLPQTRRSRRRRDLRRRKALCHALRRPSSRS